MSKSIDDKKQEIEELLAEAKFYLDEAHSNMNWSRAFMVPALLGIALAVFTNAPTAILVVSFISFGISQYYQWQAGKFRRLSAVPMRRVDRLIEEFTLEALDELLLVKIKKLIKENKIKV